MNHIPSGQRVMCDLLRATVQGAPTPSIPGPLHSLCSRVGGDALAYAPCRVLAVTHSTLTS